MVFSAGAPINDVLAVVGDISGNYKSDSSSVSGVTASASVKLHTFLAGPRVIGRSGQRRFYAQFLVGAVVTSASLTTSFAGSSLSTSASDTEFCFAPGGGVDVDLGSHSAVRVGINERFVHANGYTAKEFQLQVGLVYRFGK